MKERTRGIGWLTAALVLVATLNGCSLGDKGRQADRVHAAVERATAAGSVQATMKVTATFDPDLARSGGSAAMAAIAGRPLSMTSVANITFPGRRAHVVLPEGIPIAGANAAGGGVPAGALLQEEAAETSAPTAPEVVFSGSVVFVQRSQVTGRERRGWLALDFRDVEDDVESLSATADPPTVLASVVTALHPVFVIELLQGVLPGSLRTVGVEGSGAARVTHYQGNVSLEKARNSDDLDLSDTGRELRQRAFRLVGVRDDIAHADIWLGSDGLAKRLDVRLPSRPSLRIKNDLTLSIDFDKYGAAPSVSVPGRDAAVRVDGYRALVRAVAPST